MKYRLTDKIGSGGMAEVFCATGEGPEGFERAFVVKRILPRLSDAPEFVGMFVDEAKISARLIHPNIVQVFEFAYQDGGYYIVMEPVDGMDMGRLLRRLERRGEMAPAAFVAELGRQACRGLAFAHALGSADGKAFGIVHRDVTPPNIMVAWNGTVKILDFGIARAVQELRTSSTDAGMVKGKMSYVAPELLEGQPADARSDLFSLGVVLHELLVGRRLFVGENDLETLKMVRDMPLPRPSLRNPEVKPALDRIVMRALTRDPARRYQSASEMGDDLENLVLRQRYSTRAFAEKARELVPASDDPLQATAAVQIGLGQRDSSRVVDQVSARPAPAPVPPHRAPAQAAAAATVPPRPRFGGRRPWLAALPALALVALVVLVVRHAASVPVAAPPPGSLPAAPPLPATVQVALDSWPQGASVSSAPDARGETRRLGETPVLLRLPRGELPVQLLLAKSGFAPLAFKVVPNQDKEAMAPLERAGAAAITVSETPPREHAGTSARRWRSRRDEDRVEAGPREPRRGEVALASATPKAEMPPGALTTLRFRNDVGEGFILVEARFFMDSQPLAVVTGAQPGQDSVVYAGSVRPGRHVVGTRLTYQGRGRGPFTYVSGYKMNIHSDEVVTVPADRAVVFTIAGEKSKGMNVPFEKQLSIAVHESAVRDGAPAAVSARAMSASASAVRR